MIIRGISLIMAAAIVSVCQLSRFDSGSPLFLFISGNLLVNIGLISLSAVMVRLSFMRRKFSKRPSYAAVAVAAVVFGCFGMAGFLFPGIVFALYNVIKPLDYFVFLEAGVVLGVCALTYEHQPLGVKVPILVHLPNGQMLKKRLAIWLPKPVLDHAHFSWIR